MATPGYEGYADAEALCKSVYQDTSSEYERIKPDLGGYALGFKILYGPPLVNPPILFIGYQPGGRESDAAAGEAIGERRGWPTRCEYAYEQWRLAKQMRKVWSPDFLSRCVALNAIFFRAPTAVDWKKYLGRREAEQFCFDRVKAIADVLAPVQIVAIGFETFDRLTTGKVVLSGSKNRSLVKTGALWGYPVHGIIHLSAQISNSDIDRIREFFDPQALG
jgi:hypothetical protein